MHIKNILLSGFRSYREQIFPDGFSPKTNAVVGKNGSGKSNFFAAIQFVLSDKYANLSTSERKELIHVGSGKPMLSVFVEVVFDNSDGRLVIPGRAEEKEVRIRRTVGLKQDEFRVNDRKFSAAEVRQLLESAGFSSSNPYNIVEQGKISSLANMSEQSRFQLIKDVAGTKVYENRRDESRRILEDTHGKLLQVDVSIQKLSERLKELEGDSIELKKYQHLEGEKKFLEYSIFSTELDHIKDELVKLEGEWRQQLSVLNEVKNLNGADSSHFQQASVRLAELSGFIHNVEVEKENMEKEIATATNKQVATELEAKNASQRRSRDDEEYAVLQSEKDQLTANLKEMSEKLAREKDDFSTSEISTHRLKEELLRKKHVVEGLQERRNRASLFKNKKERDNWIVQELKQKNQTVQKVSDELQDIKRQLGDVEREIIRINSSIKNSSKDTEGSEKMLLQREKEIMLTSAKRDELNQSRRKLWQEIHEQERLVQRSKENSELAKQQYERAVRYDIRQGLKSLAEILHELNDPLLSSKVYGTVIDLITVEDGFEAAVDATAGNALFNVVVDSFDTSATLLNYMNKRRKPGRLTFFPLETCNGVTKDIPCTPEVQPLAAKVHADPIFGKIIDEMFGRTAVVATLQLGAKIVKDFACDTVTVDGDQIGRKGALTGGFTDNRRLKLVTYNNQQKSTKTYETEREKFEILCQNVANVEQQITEVLNNLESLKSSNASTEQSTDAVIRETRIMEESISRLRTRRDKLVSAQNALKKVVDETKNSIILLEQEARDDFKTKWSEENQEELEQLSKELSQMMKETIQVQNQLLQKETAIQLTEDTVQHIQHRISIVDDRLRELGRRKRVVSEVNYEHAAAHAEYTAMQSRLDEIEKALENALKEKNSLEESIQSYNANQLAVTKKVEDQKNVLSTIEGKRSVLIQRQDEIVQKIRRLGITPSTVTKYSNQAISKLMHQLKQINNELQGYSHVNRKAADQYSDVLASHDDLQTQRLTLLDELKSIQELLDHLEKEKGETIERTYKQIQFQFEEVFRELVGRDDCSAQLLLIKPSSSSNETEYTGARLRVSFGADVGESDLEYLSGGQKSLVALALVFAIQRCDPAPFYLFDEVDAALDSEYRASLARMIEKHSADCQFIFTTFKTEMLSISEKVLAIFFHNKVTRIQAISKEEGVQLLRQAAMEERKRSRENDESREEAEQL